MSKPKVSVSQINIIAMHFGDLAGTLGLGASTAERLTHRFQEKIYTVLETQCK